MLRKTINDDFPDLMDVINKVDKDDARLNASLFRDFSFLSSAYLLEPCHNQYLIDGSYGVGETFMPRKLAVPMQVLADRIHYHKPLLEYGYGYGLNNWKFLNDPNPEVLQYNNDDILPPKGMALKDHVSAVRLFNGCTDENGFILVHVAIITQTYRQIQSYDDMFEGAKKGDREQCNRGLEKHLESLRICYDLFMTMWNESRPKNYLKYRTFIMGVKGNDDIFPGGVFYEGVSDKKLAFRGETGAQDSMIPTADSALGVTYPRNILTEYLFQMREYRPANHTSLVEWCKAQNKESNLNAFCAEDNYSNFLMLCNVNAAFRFRHQHWSMVKKYIINNTKYPRATGGTPITTWLPNQIGACLEMSQNIAKQIDPSKLSPENREEYHQLKEETDAEIDRLFKEVVALQKDFDGKQDLGDFHER